MATLAELGKKHPITTEGVEFPVDDETATMQAGDIVEAWITADRDLDPLLAGPAMEQLLKMKEQYPDFVLHYIKIETRKITVQFSAAPGSGGISQANGQAIAGDITLALAWTILIVVSAVAAIFVATMAAYFQMTRGWIFVKPPPVGNALIHALHTTTKKGMPDIQISVDQDVRGTTGANGEPVLVEDLLAGPHIFTGETIAGFHAPAPITQSVLEGQQVVIEIWYRPESEPEPTTGYLTVDTSPVKGEVWVGGTSYGDAPIEPIELDIGTYDVSYGPVEGYEAPPPDTATIVGGVSLGLVAFYTPIEGPWYEKYIQYALIGGGVILGAAVLLPQVIRAISKRGAKE